MKRVMELEDNFCDVDKLNDLMKKKDDTIKRFEDRYYYISILSCLLMPDIRYFMKLLVCFRKNGMYRWKYLKNFKLWERTRKKYLTQNVEEHFFRVLVNQSIANPSVIQCLLIKQSKCAISFKVKLLV